MSPDHYLWDIFVQIQMEYEKIGPAILLYHVSLFIVFRMWKVFCLPSFFLTSEGQPFFYWQHFWRLSLGLQKTILNWLGFSQCWFFLWRISEWRKLHSIKKGLTRSWPSPVAMYLTVFLAGLEFSGSPASVNGGASASPSPGPRP